MNCSQSTWPGPGEDRNETSSGQWRPAASDFLPGRHGIGDLGRRLTLSSSSSPTQASDGGRCCRWGRRGIGNSPYQSHSSFAGNPLLIDLDDLVARGWLAAEACPADSLLPEDKVDFDAVRLLKEAALRLAHEGWKKHGDDPRFQDFAAANHVWLDDYVLYEALKDAHGGVPWYQWEPELVAARRAALASMARTLERRDQLPLVCAVRVRDPVAGAQGRLAGSTASC